MIIIRKYIYNYVSCPEADKIFKNTKLEYKI